MGNDGEELVSITLYREIKAPPPVHPGLPDATGLVVLLGTEGRVAKIANQKGDSSVKSPLNMRRSAFIASTEALGVEKLH